MIAEPVAGAADVEVDLAAAGCDGIEDRLAQRAGTRIGQACLGENTGAEARSDAPSAGDRFERAGDSLEDGSPLEEPVLAEQPRVRIPRGVLALDHPGPGGRGRQRY